MKLNSLFNMKLIFWVRLVTFYYHDHDHDHDHIYITFYYHDHDQVYIYITFLLITKNRILFHVRNYVQHYIIFAKHLLVEYNVMLIRILFCFWIWCLVGYAD